MSSSEALIVAKQSLLVLMPELLIVLMATAMMTAGAFVRLPRRVWALASVGTLLGAVVLIFGLRTSTTDPYAAIVVNDALSGYSRLFLALMGLVILGLAHEQVDDTRAPEFFGAILMMHAGAMFVASTNDLVFLFVGLELVSMPTYLILYLSHRSVTTQESATKYFFLSIFSSGLLLFGLSYLYGVAGISNLKALAYLIHWKDNILPYPQPQLSTIGLVFVMAGLGFRVACVPFHWYAPDVYDGSPTVVASLLAWIPKAVGFLAMIRVLTPLFGWDRGLAEASQSSNLSHVSDKAVYLAGLLAIVTMTLGNTVALQQVRLKRLFAYSSIAHAGYLLIGIAAAFRNGPSTAASVLGAEAVLFYLATYALMTLGAFGVIIAMSTPERPIETVDDLSGLAWSSPLSALAMGLCLFSLAGVPPMAGFYGKFWIFSSAMSVAKGPDFGVFMLLAIVGGLNAAIGAYYYLRILMKMVFSSAPSYPLLARVSWPVSVAVGTCASLSFLLGPLAGPLVKAARESAVAAHDLTEPQPITSEAMEKSGRLPAEILDLAKLPGR